MSSSPKVLSNVPALLLSLPPIGVTALWLVSAGHPEMLRSDAWEPLYWILIGASLLSFVGSIALLFATRRSTAVILCVLANVGGVAANCWGVGVVLHNLPLF